MGCEDSSFGVCEIAQMKKMIAFYVCNDAGLGLVFEAWRQMRSTFRFHVFAFCDRSIISELTIFPLPFLLHRLTAKTFRTNASERYLRPRATIL